MAETPEGIVEELLPSNYASPDVSTPNGAPNGKLTSPEAPDTDADGDVKMDKASHANGHTETTDAKPVAHYNSFTPYRSPNHLASPDADADDDARPPPAKRARKFSDADQASIANVSHTFETYTRMLIPRPCNRDSQDWLSSSCYRFFHPDERRSYL